MDKIVSSGVIKKTYEFHLSVKKLIKKLERISLPTPGDGRQVERPKYCDKDNNDVKYDLGE